MMSMVPIAIIGSRLQAIDTGGPTVDLGFGSPSAIGKLLLERFLIGFEAAVDLEEGIRRTGEFFKTQMSSS